MSFALTAAQVLDQSKTVTRRLRWKHAKVGMVVQPVEKSQGLKKGERVRKLGPPIRFTRVTREGLTEGLSQSDVWREGFPHMSPCEFAAMFCRHMRCTTNTEVTRIQFEYLNEEHHGR